LDVGEGILIGECEGVKGPSGDGNEKPILTKNQRGLLQIQLNRRRFADVYSLNQPGYGRWYSESLRAGWSVDRIPVGVTFSVPSRPAPRLTRQSVQ
jgi:hypothetical protein